MTNLPHQMCLVNDGLRIIHIVFDLITAISYFWIAGSFMYLLKKLPIVPYRWMVILFTAFLTGCGATHLMEVVTFWSVLYELEAIVMGITAMATMVTAVLIGPFIAMIVMEHTEHHHEHGG